MIDSPKASSRSDGFTLTEMLVAIGILVGLIVLTLSVTGGVRSKAQQISCLQNLRTLGAAVLAYSNDHGGVLPGPVPSVHRPLYQWEAQATSLAGFLAPYLGVQPSSQSVIVDPLICPAAKMIALREGRKIDRLTSYIGALSVWHDGREMAHLPFGYRSGESRPQQPQRLQSLPYPSMSILLLDYDGKLVASRGLLAPEAAYHPVHGELRNALFADGRVEPCWVGRFSWSVHNNSHYLDFH